MSLCPRLGRDTDRVFWDVAFQASTVSNQPQGLAAALRASLELLVPWGCREMATGHREHCWRRRPRKFLSLLQSQLGAGQGAFPTDSSATFCLLGIPVLTHPLILVFLTWPDHRGCLGDKDRTGVLSPFSLSDSESQNLVFGAAKGHQGWDQPGVLASGRTQGFPGFVCDRPRVWDWPAPLLRASCSPARVNPTSFHPTASPCAAQPYRLHPALCWVPRMAFNHLGAQNGSLFFLLCQDISDSG